MNIFVRSVSMRMSPGSLPNQFISHGAKCNIAPMMTSISPAFMSQRPMISPARLLAI